MNTKVKIASDKELASFVRPLLREIFHFCSRLKEEQLKEQIGCGVMALHKKRVIREDIDDRKAQLSIVDGKVSSRSKGHREAEGGAL